MKRTAQEELSGVEKQAAQQQDQNEDKNTTQIDSSQKPTEQKGEEKGEQKEKKNRPGKQRYAFITGYNGFEYQGCQKNPGIHSVEGELEKVFYKLDFILDYNFGDLKKIGWGRASRTDKKVHALQNVFSAKLHIDKNGDMEEVRAKINAELPADQHMFAIFPVGNRFNAKNTTSHRNYSYFLPTFMLKPIQSNFLGKTKEQKKAEGKNKDVQMESAPGQDVGGGVKKIMRQENEDDELDLVDKAIERNIDHVPEADIQANYSFRLGEEQKELIKDVWGGFCGTKNYHNFTKGLKATEMAANRYMLEMYADRYMYFNQDSGELTNEQDPRAVEYVYLYLKGQSFLFNQIRKMVGSLIQICRGSLGKGFINNCHRNNKLQIALSPGDGLLLEKVAYDKYNYLPQTSAPIMISLVSTKKEIQDFRNEIAGFIAQREFKDRAFTKWLSWFDDNRESMYIDWDPEDVKVQTATERGCCCKWCENKRNQ